MLTLVIQRHKGIADEGLHQQPLHSRRVKPARHHVETGGFVQFAHRCAVRAFDVIGEDFELRDGVGAGTCFQQQAFEIPRGEEPLSGGEFLKLAKDKAALLQMDMDMLKRQAFIGDAFVALDDEGEHERLLDAALAALEGAKL